MPTPHIVRESEAWGDWLNLYEWSHWLTLTVREVWSPVTLLQRFERDFVRFATKAAQRPVPFAYAIEGGALGNRAHLHALIYGTSMLGCVRLKRAWRYGRAWVDVYDAGRGATYYLAKEIGGSALDYGVSSRMPPLAK